LTRAQQGHGWCDLEGAADLLDEPRAFHDMKGIMKFLYQVPIFHSHAQTVVMRGLVRERTHIPGLARGREFMIRRR
jgi:hypothetical protein